MVLASNFASRLDVRIVSQPLWASKERALFKEGGQGKDNVHSHPIALRRTARRRSFRSEPAPRRRRASFVRDLNAPAERRKEASGLGCAPESSSGRRVFDLSTSPAESVRAGEDKSADGMHGVGALLQAWQDEIGLMECRRRCSCRMSSNYVDMHVVVAIGRVVTCRSLWSLLSTHPPSRATRNQNCQPHL